jgi:hypothetical protein
MSILRSAVSIGLVFHWATACVVAAPTVYNVRDYGALPDGQDPGDPTDPEGDRRG